MAGKRALRVKGGKRTTRTGVYKVIGGELEEGSDVYCTASSRFKLKEEHDHALELGSKEINLLQ